MPDGWLGFPRVLHGRLRGLLLTADTSVPRSGISGRIDASGFEESRRKLVTTRRGHVHTDERAALSSTVSVNRCIAVYEEKNHD